eukprot:11212222-Lingulodinium_polyedra.AAC.1
MLLLAPPLLLLASNRAFCGRALPLRNCGCATPPAAGRGACSGRVEHERCALNAPAGLEPHACGPRGLVEMW